LVIKKEIYYDAQKHECKVL